MSVPSQPHPLVLVWSNKLLSSLFRTEEYTTSRIAVSGQQLHLIDSLTSSLADRLQELLDAKGLAASPIIFRNLDRGSNAYAGLSAQGDAVAKVVYLAQLHADLLDRGELLQPGPRHLTAQVELWALSRLQLERGSFALSKTPGFRRLVEVAGMVSVEKEDLYVDFWSSRIWPSLVEGKHALRKSSALFAVVQLRANSFISNRYKVFRDQIRHYVAQSVIEGQGDSEMDDTPIGKAIDSADAIKRSDVSLYNTEAMALENVWLDDYVRRVLDIYAVAAGTDRLGLLIYLFRTFMMPNVASIGKTTGGKNQQIAAILNHWRNDPDAFLFYLTDDTRGLWLDEPLARTIFDVVQRGFDEVSSSIDAAFVTGVYNRFNMAIRPRLEELFPDDDSERGPDAY